MSYRSLVNISGTGPKPQFQSYHFFLSSFPRLETEAQRQSLQSHKLPSLRLQPHAPLVREQVFQTPGLGTCPSASLMFLHSVSLSTAHAPLEGQNQLLAVAFSWQNSKGFLPYPPDSQAPPTPLAPHHLVLVRDQCPYQLHHFPRPGADIPRAHRQPYGHGFAAALSPSLPPPTLWLPEGHLAEVQINGFNRQSSDLP